MYNIRQYILDSNHIVQPCDDLKAWGQWFKTADRHVGKTKIGDAKVSTVFMGLDHQYGDGPPLIFETMIFGSLLDGYERRCSTWAQAEQQHEEVCRLLRAELAMNPRD